MSRVRMVIAVAAAGALVALALVVGSVARGALTKAASPSAGAAQAVYCPKERKRQEQEDFKAFQRKQESDRKAFFATHPSAKDRTAFLRRQHD